MIKLGDYNLMEVSRFTSSGAYLRLGDEEALLPRKFVDPALQQGDKIEVFVFNDSEDRLTATTQTPKAKAGEFAFLKVVDTNKYGAFLDWGLEKDLLVPFSEQHEKMEKGRKYIVRIAIDHRSKRLIGSSKVRDFFRTDVSGLQVGQKVNLFVYGTTDLGIKVIIDELYDGLLYKNEVFEPLGIGERTVGHIKKIREDGKLDITLYKPGMEGVKDAETIILNRLKLSGGYLPYNDSTSPEIIRDELLMSKKTFKKAIGSLYKDRIITFQDNGFVLNEAPSKLDFAKKKDVKEIKPASVIKKQKPPTGKIKSEEPGKTEKKSGQKGSLESRIRRKKE